MKKIQTRINQEIRAASVRLIDEEGEQVGITTRAEALKRAEEAGLDVVEVSPNSDPPVCKIMNFGKYKYELAKKEKENKKKQHTIVTKEIRLRPKIEEHDFIFKMRHARKFLEAGHRVKATVLFRGREMAHREYGIRILERLREELDDIAKVENEPRMEGGQLTAYFFKK